MPVKAAFSKIFFFKMPEKKY